MKEKINNKIILNEKLEFINQGCLSAPSPVCQACIKKRAFVEMNEKYG